MATQLAVGKSRWSALVLVAVLALGLHVGASASARASEDCSHIRTAVPDLRVEVDAVQPQYEVGEDALVTVRVRRVVGAARAEFGLSGNAGGISVVVGAKVGDVILFGSGTTNEKGFVRVPVRVRQYAPAGTAHVWAYAHKTYYSGYCLQVLEWGSAEGRRLFRVER